MKTTMIVKERQRRKKKRGDFKKKPSVVSMFV
jgi:hypothetical protein